MPCHRCERVQTDPDPARPASPWAIAVIGRQQVLVCPACQQEHPDWIDELDRCPRCESTRLKMMLGSIICKSCGADF
jgi:uncharacterized protein YbaR (Trm112 family)